jgi:predicted nicotinamide N-methyase
MLETHILESDYFGGALGTVELAQLSYGQFQHECSSTTNKINDNTGLRLYSGGHVAIRLLLKYCKLVQNKRIVELGCGVGAFGLLGCSKVDFMKLLLTDGEAKTEHLVNLNTSSIYGHTDNSCKVQYSQLLWGSIDQIQEIKNTKNDSQPFDVVIGCELMYYRTNMKDLVDTVMQLTDCSGLFIHAHLFRKAGQECELIEQFSLHDWCTYEVPHRHFIDADELNHHPEWYKVRSLVSGPRLLMEQLVTAAEYSSWRLFKEDYPSDDEDDERDETSKDCEDGVFPSIFK